MQKTTYYCDGCGTEKRDVNHWWGIKIDTSGWTVRQFQVGGSNTNILCGQRCVIAAVTKYMDQQTDSTEKKCRDSDHS